MASETVVCVEQEKWNCENDNDPEDSYSYDEITSVHKGGSNKQRVYFTSNVQNNFIRNASTGVQYPFRVGSKESKQLFKIVDTTGRYDVNGKKIYPPRYRLGKGKKQDSFAEVLPNANTNHLYYDTPEEYIGHLYAKQRMNANLNPEFVKSWHEAKKTALVGKAE
jgi:hypothetical protein